MAERTVVQCRACANPYSVRLVREEFLLPTTDGKCECGSETFVDLGDGQESPGGTE
jgi:hypothetical protein